MLNKKIIKQVENYFNVGIMKGKEGDNDYIYRESDVIDSKTFDELSEELKKKLDLLPEDQKGFALSCKKKDNNEKIKKENNMKIEKKLNNNILNKNNELYDFDVIDKDINIDKKSIENNIKNIELSEKIKKKKEEKLEYSELENIDETEINLSSEEENKFYDNKLEIINEEIQWFLSSPNKKYDYFYEQKKELINEFLTEGQVKFESLMKELEKSYVDVSESIYDLKEIQSMMETIQKYRDRVSEIQILCNKQYFFWERYIDLLKGVLSRIIHEKPVIRQDGIYHQHMRDIELYFLRLKSLYKSCEQIIENLDSANKSLSRKVTILLGGKEDIERYSYSSDKKNNIEKDYDILPDSVKIKKKIVGTKEISW